MAIGFTRATKEQSRLRLALSGPSGSGKTYTALTLAMVLASAHRGRTALIDSEHGSARKYADLFDFDHLDMASFHPDTYTAAIQEAGQAGYPVLVVDSITHEWTGPSGILDLHDRAASKRGGNSFAAWADVTPLHHRFIEAILSSPCHVIATLRTKMAYSQELDERGKQVVRKLGLKPIQRDETEYEFDVWADLDQDNTLVVAKSRLTELHGAVIRKPGRELGEQLIEWLGRGAPIKTPEQLQKLADACYVGHRKALQMASTMEHLEHAKALALADISKMTDDQRADLNSTLSVRRRVLAKPTAEEVPF